MIPLPSTNPLNISLDQSGQLSPAKPGLISIDLSDFLSSKTPITPSSLSINDSASTKGDEDSLKPFSLEISTQCSKSTETYSSYEVSIFDPNITIGEIISKRTYSKRQKGTKKRGTKGKGEFDQKGKEQRNTEFECEEAIVKKVKLENGEFSVPGRTANAFSGPEIILKDGKVQVAMAKSLLEENQNELEIVHPEKKKITTSTSFKQMSHTEKWTEKETTKFYRALELFGTDFSMIAKVFRNRNRNQIKNKFLREERMAPEKVNGMFKGTKTGHFQTLINKFEKIKRAQKSLPITNTEEKNEASPGLNLLASTQGQRGIQDCLEIKNRSRNERSGSFYSTASLDSIDQAIMEDLADILLPQKSLFAKS